MTGSSTFTELRCACSEIELRELATFHQARVIINQIEDNCNNVWDALEKLEEVQNKAMKSVEILPEIRTVRTPVDLNPATVLQTER